MSAGVMNNEEVNSSMQCKYIQHCFSRLAIVDVPQEHNLDSRVPTSGMRSRANSMSIIPSKERKVRKARRAMRLEPYRFELRPTRSRTKSENETDLPPELPYFALPIDNMLSSNLFKSRSMESIDAPSSEENTKLLSKEQLSDSLISLSEGNSVLNGLNRLHVSK